MIPCSNVSYDIVDLMVILTWRLSQVFFPTPLPTQEQVPDYQKVNLIALECGAQRITNNRRPVPLRINEREPGLGRVLGTPARYTNKVPFFVFFLRRCLPPATRFSPIFFIN